MFRRSSGRIFGALYDWLDTRLGLGPVIDRLLRDPVPERGGWWYTLGAAIFLLLMVQIVTGIFLLFDYVPSLSEARNSILFIQQQVFLGWLVRGIHYWNMVMLVLLVGVHMTRTFLSAAYKVPRELTWVLGTILLVLMVATAFTGGILRWDQSGYFDAVVGLKIVSWTPLLGPWLAEVWRGGDVIGPATLSRTFAFHVWLLPAALLLLATVHIALVIIQGQYGSWVNYEPEPADAPPPTEDEIASHQKLEREILDPRSHKVNLPVRTTWFYPYHVFREAVVALGLLFLVMIVALLFPAPIEAPPDPATTVFGPSSMWFFLFLDQTFLLFPGAWLIPIGATVAPGIVFLLLVLVPWLDRSAAIRPNQRPASIFFIFVIIGAIFVLGLLAASRIYNYEFINAPR